jgi:hypothetical protein
LPQHFKEEVFRLFSLRAHCSAERGPGFLFRSNPSREDRFALKILFPPEIVVGDEIAGANPAHVASEHACLFSREHLDRPRELLGPVEQEVFEFYEFITHRDDPLFLRQSIVTMIRMHV